MESMNIQLFLLINTLAGNRFLDGFFAFIAVAAPYLSGLALVVLYLAHRRNPALFALYAALGGLGLNQLIGLLYFHPRPAMMGLGRSIIHHGLETSFPSDHATLVFAIAFSLLFSGERLAGWLFLLFAVVTGFARVYCGVHFPLDIAGSIAVSLVTGLAVKAAARWLSGLNRRLNHLFDSITRNRWRRL